MGGEISLTSTPGVGSRFRVRMLLSQSARDAPAARIENRVTGYEGPRRTIMVARGPSAGTQKVTIDVSMIGFEASVVPEYNSFISIA